MLDTNYPYLISSLVMLIALAVGLLLVPGHRRGVLVSGALSAPFAFSSVLFVPEYWRPQRLFTFGAGVEDLIFSFAGGGLIWWLAIHLVSPRLTVSLQAERVVRRYLVLTAGFFALVLVLVYVLGFNVMTAVVVSGGVILIMLLVLRPDLGRLALVSAVGYCFGYTLFCALLFAVWPQFLEQWNWDNLTGLTVLSVPIEESVWALVFAACWTLAMGYAFDARLSGGADAG